LSLKVLEHAPCCGEPVSIWREDVAAEGRINGFDNHVFARISRVLKDDVNVAIVLTFHACDSADDLVDVKFFLVDPVITGGTASGADGVQGSYRRRDDSAELNAVSLVIAKTLHLGTPQRTAHSENGECR